MIKSTFIEIGNIPTRRKLVNRVLKALNDITGLNNGTLRHPYELASSILGDGRTLIQAIYEDGEIVYNDGYYIVELDDTTLFVDVTAFAAKDMNNNNTK